ncbi:MAG: DUF423 domain-containing protein [Leptospirales bacterium]|jgi:uncharacterized membrane protein YgdD (TMEM256/DUF423 family)
MILRERWFLFLGGVAGGLAVLGGAFGAHALKARLSERAFEIFELAIRYQMYHGLALLAVGLLLCVLLSKSPGGAQAAADMAKPPLRLLSIAGILFLVGIVLFCGSLYVYSLADIRFVVRITPFGGLAWLAAWTCLAIAGLRTFAAPGGGGR